MFVQNNVDMTKFSAMKQNIIGALAFYTAFATDANYVWNDIQEPSLLSFSNGKIAIYFGYSWDVFQIKANNPNLKFEVFPVPNLPGKKSTIASYWVNGVSGKSKHQKEAMLFMHYLAQKEVAQKLYTEQSKTRLFGTPYARVDLAKTLESNPLIAPFVQQAPFAHSSFFSSDTHDDNYNERLNAYLGNAVRSILTRSSIDGVTDGLVNGVSQVRAQFGLQ
jgi:ABC-type glycerol-3-phosphate transport system substrate-binding protein